MKSILYVGATLMIGASIYGFVDYRKTSHDKKFSSMYKVKEVNEPAVPVKEGPAKAKENKVVSKTDEPVIEKATTATVSSNKKLTRKKFRTELFSRAIPAEKLQKVLDKTEKEEKEEKEVTNN